MLRAARIQAVGLLLIGSSLQAEQVDRAAPAAVPNPMIHAEGTRTVDDPGRPVELRGLQSWKRSEPPADEPVDSEGARHRDRDRLMDLHREGLEAHLERDVDKLMAAEAAEAVFASRGEISHPSLDQRREMFVRYFGSTEFTTYRDTAEPIVRVSQDGTLGWVIARVEARGTQKRPDGTTGELSFISAWIELYEKLDGKWRRTGNVSNFRPD